VSGGRRKARERIVEAHPAGKCEGGKKCAKGRQCIARRINPEE
jgi:hypothetical protein